MIRITSTQLLEEDTQIIVEGKGKAIVCKSKMVPSSNKAGPICLHTVKFPDGKIQDCNYAFIIIKCETCDHPAKQYMMHQAVCDDCGKGFVESHRKILT